MVFSLGDRRAINLAPSSIVVVFGFVIPNGGRGLGRPGKGLGGGYKTRKKTSDVRWGGLTIEGEYLVI